MFPNAQNVVSETHKNIQTTIQPNEHFIQHFEEEEFLAKDFIQVHILIITIKTKESKQSKPNKII